MVGWWRCIPSFGSILIAQLDHVLGGTRTCRSRLHIGGGHDSRRAARGWTVGGSALFFLPGFGCASPVEIVCEKRRKPIGMSVVGGERFGTVPFVLVCAALQESPFFDAVEGGPQAPFMPFDEGEAWHSGVLGVGVLVRDHERGKSSTNRVFVPVGRDAGALTTEVSQVAAVESTNAISSPQSFCA